MNEEKLKAAAGELEAALLKDLPDGKECEHEFSQSFHRKMKRIMFRANHPVLGSGWRCAVAALLAVALLGGSVLIAVPKARASFVGWVKEVYGNGVHYFVPDVTSDDIPEELPTAYHLGWVPEGYALTRISNSNASTAYIYVNAEGHQLCFSYIIPKANAGVAAGFDVRGHTHKVVSVGGLQADLYINGNKEGSSALIWMDKSGTVLFSVMGIFDEAVLIKLAENILPGMIE